MKSSARNRYQSVLLRGNTVSNDQISRKYQSNLFKIKTFSVILFSTYEKQLIYLTV